MSEYGTDIDLDMYPVSNTTISDTTYNVSGNENANEPNFANNLIVSGGTVNINNAVFASNNTIGNGGTINVSAMGPILDTIISSGGVLEAKVAQLYDTIIYSGGEMNISSLSIGEQTVARVVANNTKVSGGTINVGSGGDVSGASIFSGGVINAANVASIESGVTVYDGGVLIVGGLGELNVVNTGIGNTPTSIWYYNSQNIVSSGGIMSVTGHSVDDTVGSGGNLYVFGLTENTIVSNQGNVYISAGGSATTNKVFSGGMITVSTAGVAISNSVYDGGEMTVLSGGSAVGNTFSNAGALYISSGGLAVSNIIQDGASIIVEKDATFSDNNLMGGHVSFLGADLSNAVINSGVIVTISSAGNAVGNTLHSGGYLFLMNANASNTTLDNGGTMTISGINDSSYHIISTSIISAAVNVESATAIDTILNDGVINVGPDANVYNVQAMSGGLINIYDSTGHVSNATVYSGASLTTFGVAEGNTINSGATFSVASGGSAIDNTLNSGATLYISSSGSATGTILSSGAVLHVSSGGFITGTILSAGAVLSMDSGAFATGNTWNSGSIIVAQSGASFINNNVSGGVIEAPGGYLENTVIVDGYVSLGVGGIAINNTIQSGGVLTVVSGSVSKTTIETSGTLNISGGSVRDTIIGSGGVLYLGSGGTATNTTINSGGNLSVNYAVVISATINSGGILNAGAGDVNDPDPSISRQINNATSATVNAGGILNISRGVATGNIVSGGTINVYGSGSLLATQVNSGEVNLLDSTGAVRGVTLGSDAVLNVSAGAATGNTILSGGVINAVSGTVIGTTISNGAVLNASTGANVSNNSVFSGGTIKVSDGGLAVSNVIGSGASLVLENGGSAVGNILQSGADFTVNSGGIASAGTISSGGMMLIQSGGALQDMTIASGGSAVLDNGAALSGVVTLEKGGYLAITTSTGGTVDFTDATTPVYLLRDGTATVSNIPSGLVISGTGNATTVISGFSGTSPEDSDKITLANVKQSDVTQVTYPDADHVTFDLQNGSTITLNVIGVQDKGFALGSDANGALTYEVCFLTGTLISMVNGVCAVEDIQVGDKVAVYHPQTQKKSQRKVTWVGKKTAYVKPARFDDEAGYPVRILKNAIADNVPNKDLLVTAEHCLFFNGAFTPARMLVNGRSIFYDRTITSYDYYHIETEKHSVIMADGMLTESYLDTGNRHLFVPAQKVVSLKGRRWDKDAAAPLMVERSVVEPLYREIAERADAMNFEYQADPVQTTNDADLHLITDKGQTIRDKLISQDGRVVFIIPAHTKSVRIASRIRRLSNMVGSFVDDRNYAGLLIGDMYVSDSQGVRLFNVHTRVDDLDGWHANEEESRWTKGNALLPLDQLGDFDMPIYLSMHILDGGPYILEECEEEQKQLA